MLKEHTEKYVILQMKLFADLLESHPFSFVPLLRQVTEFACNICFTPAGNGLLFQRFSVYCLNLLKQVLLCMEYRLPKNSDGMA
jgi:hypothetical protein